MVNYIEFLATCYPSLAKPLFLSKMLLQLYFAIVLTLMVMPNRRHKCHEDSVSFLQLSTEPCEAYGYLVSKLLSELEGHTHGLSSDILSI